ncbi:MAG: tRNA-dihydrouridine synthase, partial [Coriobacteriales bacterium]|jgi:tRNA-dihydrouridine synthase B|nr:tRNA-dihydrouridine synthase [Coriobacteriales bacterium]
VKQAVSIGVIASGDVFSAQDVRSYREDFGADAVMAARGAQGNPWIFVGQEPTLAQRVQVAREHTVGLAQRVPHRLPSMRKHIAWYFKGTPHATSIRRAAHSCVTVSDYERLFGQVLAGAFLEGTCP